MSAAITFIGFNLTFFPQFVVGYLGMPRRYHNYPAEFQIWHIMSSAGASILAVGVLIPAVYFLWSLKYGPKAGNNPWGASGLEWMTQSPPIKDNFDEPPVVTWEAYNYEDNVEEEAQRDREIMPGAEPAAREEARRDMEQAQPSSAPPSSWRTIVAIRRGCQPLEGTRPRQHPEGLRRPPDEYPPYWSAAD